MNLFYTTHCPKCRVLKRKLEEKGIAYTENEDVDEMVARGFKSAPILVVNGKAMTFKEALNWVGAQ